ncbi:hypothetical protein SPBR_03765 [Sporothrix brasiliensis 5110]|uniref:FHA domain-containing protein n=1 Tax=Sporothrix brasiliensis 5110 TaxID=1398154 RepID=A0A0C2J095_9PEZI|nr:uncharacterized protein SPBR_03765 [Sporothrix brasiliensis 5110]KIH94781.1 hypothetical protein SPBR_03765 [Sporothrix brasiliensis 5110]
MAESYSIEYTPSVASYGEGQPSGTDVEPCIPLAWLEIESAPLGEFKQSRNLRFQCKAVSSIHCEIYSVLFDKSEQYRPLIYVRDCQSTFGTFVNGQLIGQKPFVTAGWILEDGDVVSAGPCSLRLCAYPVSKDEETALSRLQQQEALQFADQYLIKDTILGNGSFSTVHMAMNVKTNQQVVCKIHDFPYLKGIWGDVSDRIQREMSIWSQLDHSDTSIPKESRIAISR